MLRKIFFLALLCATYTWSQAQQVVEINTDSLTFNSAQCPTPVTGSFYPSGTADNYNSATDSIIVKVFWGDGTFALDTVELYEAGTTDYWWSSFSHVYTLAGTYYPMIIATAPNGIADTAYANDSVYITTNCVTIDGYTYEDLNSNCVKDASDSTIRWAGIRVTTLSGDFVTWASSDVNGHYSLTLPTGLSNLLLWSTDWSGLTVTCPTGGAYPFNSNSNQSFDFGFECLTDTFDLYHFNNAFIAPPGDTGWVWVYATARHCDTSINIEDTFMLVLDPLVHYAGTYYGPTPDAVSGDTLWWFDPLLKYTWSWNTHISIHRRWLGVRVETDTTLSLGDSICLYSQSEFFPEDIAHYNNYREWCPEVGVSYDPNNKLVFEQGKGSNGNIDTNSTRLQYVVNFQNTGTAPAQHVYIIDSISPNLDLNSLKLEAFSHPVEIKYLKDRKLRFDFFDINLVDSATNPIESQGFVAFTLDLVEGLPVGTQIENTAGIYFDYNAPIITNTTLNTLYNAPESQTPDTLIIELDKSNVTCLNWDNGKASVKVISGTAPYSFVWSTGSTAGSLQDLSAGTYTITVTDNELKEAIASIEIIENRQFDDPTVAEVTGTLSVQAWESYIYTMANVTGNTFQWNAQGGDVLGTANNQAEILWHAGPTGTIIVTQISEHGCKASRETEVPILFVGQDELEVSNLSIYPNPSSERIYLTAIPEGSKVSVSIYDLSGRQVAMQSIRSIDQSIYIGTLSAGPYMVRLTQDGEVLGTTLMVKE